MSAKEMLMLALSRAVVVGKDILIAWMVLMTLWGMFSGYHAWKWAQRSEITIDYIAGNFAASGDKKEK
jgi:hypothetical protein